MVAAVLSTSFVLLLSTSSRYSTVESFRTTTPTPVRVVSLFDPHPHRQQQLRPHQGVCCHRPRPIASKARASTTTQRYYQSRRSTKTAVVVDDNQQERQDDDVVPLTTIQILMSDTGGGHRASANALRDALRTLPDGGGDRITCDIVDLYADYGNVWPYTSYPQLYKLLASYPWSWALFYWFGATDLGLAVNDFLLRLACRDTFRQCLARIQPSTGRRADLVVSVHPLTNALPLEIVRQLDQDDEKRGRRGQQKTPFCTVVTDLGSAHPTWFCDGYVWSLRLFSLFLPSSSHAHTFKRYLSSFCFGTHAHTHTYS